MPAHSGSNGEDDVPDGERQRTDHLPSEVTDDDPGVD